MDETTTAPGSAPRLPTWARSPWQNDVHVTLAMEDAVETYLNLKGIDYCIELKFFMLNIEG